MKTIKDIDIAGKTVLLRADYNVPVRDGQITDDYRMQQSLPTVNYLLEHGCRLVIISHLGRPKGRRDPQFSLKPVAAHLQRLIGEEVVLAEDFSSVDSRSNRITMLENLRFWPDEEDNSEVFAEKIASLGELFVQDGFGVVHRAHASTDAVTKHIPSVAGLLLEKEIATITAAMDNPDRPLVAIIGGAKVSDKIELIEQLTAKADKLVIGGAMANTFLASKRFGYDLGNSMVEQGVDKELDRIWDSIEAKTASEDFLLLPVEDVAVGKAAKEGQQRREVATSEVAEDDMVLDFGSASTEEAIKAINDAGTVIWNGPLGVTELPEFAEASRKMAEAITASDAYSIVGGGDTAGFVQQLDMVAGFDWVSTGGGAALDLMAGKELPGIAALKN